MTCGLVEDCVPVFPDGFVAVAADGGGDVVGCALVAYFELFKCYMRVGCVTARFCATSCTEGGGSELHDMVAVFRCFACGEGEVYLVVKDTEGTCELS